MHNHVVKCGEWMKTIVQTMGTNGPEDMYLTSLGKKGLVDRSA